MQVKDDRHIRDSNIFQDSLSTYEPGKRHWLKVKKDYLEEVERERNE